MCQGLGLLSTSLHSSYVLCGTYVFIRREGTHLCTELSILLDCHCSVRPSRRIPLLISTGLVKSFTDIYYFILLQCMYIRTYVPCVCCGLCLTKHQLAGPSTSAVREWCAVLRFCSQAIRVGRGPGSGRGKTCGRGHKGQGQRNRKRVRVGFEGGQTPFYLRVPKRGFVNV